MTFRSQSAESGAALTLNAVRREFGALVAVDSVSLSIEPQERRAVLGSNGAGKTTLFNLITGDFPVTDGQIIFFGEDVTRLPTHQRVRRGLRRTYQISLLFGSLSVADNIYLAARGVSGGRFDLRQPKRNSAVMAEVEEILHRTQLEGVSHALVEELSHGQQRQLEIAMAMVGTPRLILLDEPAAGLSPAERGELVALLNNLPREIAFVIIEHDMDVALRVVDSVTMMHNGRVFKEGSPAEIEADASVQALYLGASHG